MDSYDTLLVAWGIIWMLGGFVLVYLVHQVTRVEEKIQARLPGNSHSADSGVTAAQSVRAA